MKSILAMLLLLLSGVCGLKETTLSNESVTIQPKRLPLPNGYLVQATAGTVLPDAGTAGICALVLVMTAVFIALQMFIVDWRPQSSSGEPLCRDSSSFARNSVALSRVSWTTQQQSQLLEASSAVWAPTCLLVLPIQVACV